MSQIKLLYHIEKKNASVGKTTILSLKFFVLVDKKRNFLSSASNHISLYIPSMRKSFILLYSLLLRIASSLLNPTKIRTDNRMPPRNMPTNRDVFDVEFNCISLGLGLIVFGIRLVTAIRLDSLISNQWMETLNVF